MPDERLRALFDNNRQWARAKSEADPGFFDRLSHQQSPRFLWIGCADSRVPATEICGLDPGEMFVHRNVANLVVHTDFNCLAVLQFAVEVLRVSDVIVCGHYGCGGVRAALGTRPLGLIDNWLRNIKDVYERHRDELEAAGLDADARERRMCELNVRAQVENVCATTIVQDAWARGQALTVHGCVYGLENGLLKDLGASVSGLEQLAAIYRMG
ncbi:MAG: carbonate dehydratase [Myxococcota bacterium]|nr:carbonate dehydratase [Myxococcales bacterium]